MHWLYSSSHDLITKDGFISSHPEKISQRSKKAKVTITKVEPFFLGYEVPKSLIQFNIKSTLAQLGVDGTLNDILLDKNNKIIEVEVIFTSYGKLGQKVLNSLSIGQFIGKLFVKDDRRLIKTPYYLERMFHHVDRYGDPLLRFGEDNKHTFRMKIEQDRLIGYLSLKEGALSYHKEIFGFIPLIAKTLTKNTSVRSLLKLYQYQDTSLPHFPNSKNDILLVSTSPLHIRTVFARVVSELLPKNLKHTSANILQPNTKSTGDVYEIFGESNQEINTIPLEFYSLEPHKEHVFFKYRDLLQQALEKDEVVFNIFSTAPKNAKATTFITKGSQISKLNESDWISSPLFDKEIKNYLYQSNEKEKIKNYIQKQPCYPFLQAMERNEINSQGILFTKYFPSTLLKSMLLSYYVQSCLMQIYFQIPSCSHDQFFSSLDRSLLLDLNTFNIPVFWADKKTNRILKYVKRTNKFSGMFVPPKYEHEFKQACFFGIYGSNLIKGNFEKELQSLLKEIIKLKETSTHPILNKKTPIALVTGGGPGAMEMGNRIAKNLNILSCANIVDFENPQDKTSFQTINPYIDAKMTYRLENLIERQEHFYLDFPIFVMGGIGTDFELALEEVNLKVGSRARVPILLFGTKEYWIKKITTRFQCNMQYKTILGSEWISNAFFCIQTAKQGLMIYKKFLLGELIIGSQGKIYKNGFVFSSELN